MPKCSGSGPGDETHGKATFRETADGVQVLAALIRSLERTREELIGTVEATHNRGARPRAGAGGLRADQAAC